VDPRLVSYAFLAWMGAALAALARAFALRRERARHVRWAVAGSALAFSGTLLAAAAGRLLGWKAEPVREGVAAFHLVLAKVSVGLLLVQAATGVVQARTLRRPSRLHRVLGPLVLLAFAASFATAIFAYVVP
jgi:hypothetical protein